MPLTYFELQAEQQKMVERLRVRSKAFLQANDITQRQLASTIRVSETFLSDFLLGRKNLSNDTYTRLSAVLEASPEFIKAQVPNRNPRITHAQEFGKPAKGDGRIDLELARRDHNSQLQELIARENYNLTLQGIVK